MQPFTPIQGITQQASPIQALSSSGGSKGVLGTENKDNISFGDIVGSHMKHVNTTLFRSDMARDKMVRGELQNAHEFQIAGMKAGLMLKMTTTICSKVTNACTTLFQMQI